MAKQGNFTAYQQLLPLQGDISNDVKYWDEAQAKKAKESRIADNQAFLRQQKRKAQERADFDKYIGPIEHKRTGFKSLDQFYGDVIMKAKDQVLPALQVLDSDTSTREERMNAQLKLNNFSNLPQKLKNASEQFVAQGNAYREAVAKGLAWENPEMEKVYNNGFDSFRVGFDEIGNPLMAFMDLDGDGENDLMGVKSFDEISKGMPLFNIERKHNREGLAKTLAGDLGVSDITEQNGYTSFQKKAVRDEDKSLRVRTLLFGTDGIPTSSAKSFLKEKGIDPMLATPEDYQVIEKEFSDLVGTFLPEFEKEKTDFNAITNARKETRIAKDGLTEFTEAVTPSEQTWGEKVDDISGQSVGVANVEIGAIKGKEASVSNAKVKNYSFTKDGDMLVDVETVKTKAVSETEYEELKTRYDKNALPSEQMKSFLLMETQKPGSRRITVPGTNDKQVITVSPEDQADVARQLGTTIDGLKQKAGYNNDFDPEEFYNKRKSGGKPVYKGLDENGDPIFE